MKFILKLGIFCILLGIILSYQDKIVDIYNIILVKFHKPEELTKNAYYRNYDFAFVKNTDNFEPKSKEDLYDIYYTILNSGVEEYSFYCDIDYKNCINDVESLASNSTLLSEINNLVHPYNSFKDIETSYNNYGKITVNITHVYNNNEIKTINNKINEIKNSLLGNKRLSDVEKIKLFHDYIVEHNVYDSDRSDKNIINYASDTAYGALFEGHAICGGYTDAMSLFLEELKIKNYRISSNRHIWNAVYLNGSWLHLDLTWDDPVTNDNDDIIEHKFFLINTNTLKQIEKNQHKFNEEVYKELAS